MFVHLAQVGNASVFELSLLCRHINHKSFSLLSWMESFSYRYSTILAFAGEFIAFHVNVVHTSPSQHQWEFNVRIYSVLAFIFQASIILVKASMGSHKYAGVWILLYLIVSVTFPRYLWNAGGKEFLLNVNILDCMIWVMMLAGLFETIPVPYSMNLWP